ncbi:acetyl-CoA C-acyltransferase, partial [Mammaliicoccus sciuri]
QVLKGVLNRVGGTFDGSMVQDVIVGNSFPEGLQGQNIARSIALLAGLPNEVPGQTANRYCSSGLQTIAIAANEITSKQADVYVAGCVGLTSAVPMGANEA